MTQALRPAAALRSACSLLGSLVRRRRARHPTLPPPPSFGDACDELIFTRLVKSIEAAEAWRAGDFGGAWQSLIAHFRRRNTPLGFLPPERVRGLLAQVEREHPEWRVRLLDKVRKDGRQGLSVYDRIAQPLNGDFDWSRAGAGPLDDNLYGSRPHRFGFLPRWALACHYDLSQVRALDAVLAGWMAADRHPGGHPAYRSPHVVIYNVIAVLLAWPFLAALEAPEVEPDVAALRRKALRILLTNCIYLDAARGLSVANNHRLAEKFGTWLTAKLLPEFDFGHPDPASEEAWLTELAQQIYSDGGSFEHSIHYQEHACEMAVAYLLLSRLNDWTVPRSTIDRIARMLDFQLALAGPEQLPLGIGNTTEDPLLALGVGEGWQTGMLCEVGRTCFTPDFPMACAGDPAKETAFWLLQGHLVEDGARREPETFRHFAESGFCILSDNRRQTRMVFRLGPSPAIPGIGGHSHCDLLSLYLSIGGAQILAPPGTFTYRFKPHPDIPGKPNLRAHFAGAASQSGLFLEGVEPYGPLRGDFRAWQLPCHVSSHQDSAREAGLSWIEGRVEGEGAYNGCRRGIVHVWDDYWLVYDKPPDLGNGPAAFVGWQFAPGVECHLHRDGAVSAYAEKSETGLLIQPCGTGKPDLAEGSVDPFRGWISPSYGELEAAANLRFPIGHGCQTVAFLFEVGAEQAVKLRLLRDNDGWLVFELNRGGEVELILLNTAGSSRAKTFQGTTFGGRLLSLRRCRSRLRVRALGLEDLRAPGWGASVTAQTPTSFELLVTEGQISWPRGKPAGLQVEAVRDET